MLEYFGELLRLFGIVAGFMIFMWALSNLPVWIDKIPT